MKSMNTKEAKKLAAQPLGMMELVIALRLLGKGAPSVYPLGRVRTVADVLRLAEQSNAPLFLVEDAL